MTTSTTARPRPPWFPENPPSSWVDLAPSSTLQPDQTSPQQDEEDEDSEDEEDEHDYSDEETKNKVIQVKVPKPYPVDPSDQGTKPYPVDPKVNPSTLDPENQGKPRVPIQTAREETRQDGERPELKDLEGRPVERIKDNYPPVIALSNFTQYCPPTTARGLFWNWTSAGDTAVLECPVGSIGFAKWRCSGDPAEWFSLSPTLSECQSKWLNNLDSRLRDGESIGTVSGDLAQLSGLQPMYGGDLRLATKMLKHMAERMNYDIQVVTEATERESMVTELVQNVVLTASNVLDRINHVSWSDLSADDVSAAATALMVGLEENAFLLADSVSSEKIIIKPTTNICKFNFILKLL